MNLLWVVSFAWGLWLGYKHSSLIVVVYLSAALAIGEMFLSRKSLFKGDNVSHDFKNLLFGIVFYFIAAFVSSLISQGLGYLIGQLV